VTDRAAPAAEPSSDPPGAGGARRGDAVIVAGLLAVMGGWLLFGALRKSATYDEWAYLAAGAHYLSTGSNALFEDAPAGIKAWIALPTWILLAPALPDTEDRYPWNYGDHFRDRLADPDLALLLARAPIMALTLLLGWYVYRFSRALWGRWAGLLSLAVAAFEPSLLGHGRVAHGDVALVAMGLGALLFLWRFVETGRYRWVVLSALHLALAAETKFVGLALLPLFMVAVAVESAIRQPGRAGLRRGLVRAAVLLGAWSLAYAGIVALVYRSPVPVVAGVAAVRGHLEGGHPAFLLGETSRTGWWYYYPVVLLLKTPVPILLGLLALPVSLVARDRWPSFLFVMVPAAGWLVLAMLSPVCLGIRHVLLVPTLGIVALGAHAPPGPGAGPGVSRLRLLLPIGLALWVGVGTVVAFPGFISYLNLPARSLGPPYELVTDSNLDWGQDLPSLAAWLKAHGNPPVWLFYFGRDDPARFGIRVRSAPALGEIRSLGPGILALSASYQAHAVRDPELARFLGRAEPLGTPGGTIQVFRLPRPEGE